MSSIARREREMAAPMEGAPGRLERHYRGTSDEDEGEQLGGSWRWRVGGDELQSVLFRVWSSGDGSAEDQQEVQHSRKVLSVPSNFPRFSCCGRCKRL